MTPRQQIQCPNKHVAAAAAKSLQSSLTLCDPMDGSPPGSAVSGILQARTLEWVAISFSNAWKWKVKVKSLIRVRLFVTPWTAAYQAPPSMGFSRQEYWSGVPLPSPPNKHNKPISFPLLLCHIQHPGLPSRPAPSRPREVHCLFSVHIQASGRESTVCLLYVLFVWQSFLEQEAFPRNPHISARPKSHDSL